MATDLAWLTPLFFVLALVLSLFPWGAALARISLGVGAALGAALCCMELAGLPSVSYLLPFGPNPEGTHFRLATDAAWLLGFGFAAAVWVAISGSAGASSRGWSFGAAMALLGAYGVAGLQDAVSFLVAYEVMSLGGAVMIMADGRSPGAGRPVLFMLAILEAGAVALLVAFLILATHGGTVDFGNFLAAAQGLSGGIRFLAGLLLLLGFGAKLGLIPFYEWFPDAYGAGSGASGALLSGIVLNAAFFALGRGLLGWFQASPGTMLALGILLVAAGVVSAILNALYAFQEDGWRRLLAFSSAENGSIAVTLLGASLIFLQNGSATLSGLAWNVALIHLAGHALAKTCLFLTADGLVHSSGDDSLEQRGLLRGRAPWLGIGALFAVMSLAAMPPQAGFVSEWYLFQTFFQAFHVVSLAGRLVLVLGGAGLALTAAVAFATSVKLFGIGLQGAPRGRRRRIPARHQASAFILGIMVLLLAVGMPVWLPALGRSGFGIGGNAALAMRDGWLLVPLSAGFAFISPSKLIIAMPLLALIPLGLLLLSVRRFGVRRSAVWYGGMTRSPAQAATTQLAFSNALRTFYGFIYRPRVQTERDFADRQPDRGYFLRRLSFTHDVAPIFGPYLFRPLETLVLALARTARRIQSGSLNLYLGIVGVILVIILATILL